MNADVKWTLERLVYVIPMAIFWWLAIRFADTDRHVGMLIVASALYAVMRLDVAIKDTQRSHQ